MIDKNNSAAKTPPELDGTIAIRRDGSTPSFEDISDVPGAAPLEAGERIGPYEIREHIGDGGMASVYKAWHTNLHRFEALKIPRHQHTYGPEAAFLRRLLAEARTSARLHHPHIVAIHNVSEADAPLQYFAMDFVGGCDLARLLESRGRLPVGEALPILDQIASALDYAHSQGVIHRDVKPGNILLQNSGVLSEDKTENLSGDWFAKVVDFGISRAGEDTGGTRLTRSGMIVGTPEYMSPEQSGSGDAVTHRTDIYSLGVVAYEMLCGTPPFTAGDGVSRISILMKHVGDAPPAPTDFLPNLPPAAAAVITKVLAKKPEDRFETCCEFVKDLSAALATSDYAAQDEVGAVVASVIARPKTAMMSSGNTTLFNSMTNAETETPTSRPLSRTSTLLAGLGGILVGAAIVLGWIGGNNRVVVEQVKPIAKTPLVANVSSKAPVSAPTVIPTLRTETRKYKQVIRFARRTKPSAALLVGQKKVIQKGVNGERELKVLVTFRGDRKVSERIIASRVTKAPVDEIQISGTRARQPRSVQAAPRRAPTTRRAAAKTVHYQRPTRAVSARAAQALRKRRRATAKATRKAVRFRRTSAARTTHIYGDAPLPP